jgi:glycosyltransferase involved in cell wall biosynthesis
MKKVLIITYYWPPSGGAGVQRWLKFVKYLRGFGWEPVIFTPENPEAPSVDASLINDVPDGVEVIKNKIWEPYSFYKKFTGKRSGEKMQAGFLSEKKSKFEFLEGVAVWLRGNLFIPDARKYWIKPSVKLLVNYLNLHPVDIIVSTGPPHSAHMIALGLKEKLNIPWLADFRDPWTNIDFYKDLKLSKYADRVHHKMERSVLKKSDVVTVISRGMEQDFLSIHKRKYEVIPNGFDPEDAVQASDSNKVLKEKFVLAHVGSLNKDRNPVNLWRAIKELIKKDDDFSEALEIRNVGKLDFTAVEALKEFGLIKYLNKISYLSHHDVIAQQQRAALLLLLVNRTPNAKLIVTGKIFEYLISDRPILCIAPPDGDAAAIIKNTGCGEIFNFDEVDGIKRYLENAFEKFKNNKLHPNCKNVEQYDRKTLTEKMTNLFNRFV